MTRAGFFAGAEIDEGAGMRLETFVERRATREPAAYVTGHREFFGRDFRRRAGEGDPQAREWNFSWNSR